MTKQEAMKWLATFLATAREMRIKSDAAEQDLFRFLIDGEDNGPWRMCGFTSFAELIEHHKIITALRFERYKQARATLGLPACKALGVHASVAASKIPDQNKRQECVAELAAWIEDNGTIPSRETARTIAKKHFHPEPVPSARNDKIARLVQENKELKRQLREAKRELAALRRKVGDAAA